MVSLKQFGMTMSSKILPMIKFYYLFFFSQQMHYRAQTTHHRNNHRHDSHRDDYHRYHNYYYYPSSFQESYNYIGLQYEDKPTYVVKKRGNKFFLFRLFNF